MVSTCAAVGCKERAERGSRLTFHRFPKKAEIRDKWIKALKRKNFEPTKHSRVCEKHFTLKAYHNYAYRKKLRETAVPEIFDFSGFVKEDGQPTTTIQKSEDPNRIHSIQFVDVDSVKNHNLLPTQNRTVIVIDNVVKARRAENSHSNIAVAGTSGQSSAIASIPMPVIKSIFSLNTNIAPKPASASASASAVSASAPCPKLVLLPLSSFTPFTSVPKNSIVTIPSVNGMLPQSSSTLSLNTSVPPGPTVSVSVPSVKETLPQSSLPPSSSSSLGVPKTSQCIVPRIPDALTDDCTPKRLIGKAQLLKKKYKERLKVMNHVSLQLRKRKAFLENLLIRIKEKQLTSYEDVTDLMDCFVEEEDEEDELSSDEDEASNTEEYEKTIAFIDDKICKFENAVKTKSGSSNTSECEAFGLHLESVLNAMPKETADKVKNQITEVLKGYQGNKLLKMYRDFNQTFSGLENIEVHEIE